MGDSNKVNENAKVQSLRVKLKEKTAELKEVKEES